MIITSLKNLHCKIIRSLGKKKTRDELDLFLVEGRREILRAIANNLQLETLYVSAKNREKIRSSAPTFTFSEDIFRKISYRGLPTGFIATFKKPSTALSNIKLPKNPLVLVIESPEKPGNVGAILRSADAIQVDAVIISDPNVDLFNPNVIRSSTGTLFAVPVYIADSQSTIGFLSGSKINIVTTTPEATIDYTAIDYQKPTAIIMGAEDTGLSPQWSKVSAQKIKIPMHGQADSLNLSVTTALVLFEAARQRSR